MARPPRQPVRYTRMPNIEMGIHEWATFTQGGDGFKIHRTIGTAKSQITRTGHGILYRLFVVGETMTWKPVAIVHEGEADKHPYKKINPKKPTEPVCIFVIQEVPI